MPIQENALNSVLAELLSEHEFHATAEETRPSTGLKRCDVQIRRNPEDSYYTAIECKIGHGKAKMRAAVQDAKRWLKESNCCNAIALCYPEDLSEDTAVSPMNRLKLSDSLLMAKVNHEGVFGHWRTGRLVELTRLFYDNQANETYAITDTLRKTIISACEHVTPSTGQELANVLELPWDPNGRNTDPRPARIACLIIANMALLQNRMHNDGVLIQGLESLLTIREATNRQLALIDNWKKIRAIDYAPVVDPALSVLYTLPSGHSTDSLINILIETVLECVPRIHGLQLDHAGPLYHELLQTAKYDGSFYTSTTAAVLLSDLAMPQEWLNWNDLNRLTQLKICDPSCGTGTLLMAAAKTIEERYINSRGGGGAAFSKMIFQYCI